jgi:hypothetical protein
MLGLGALGTAGALPDPSWGVTATAGLRWGLRSLAVEGRYDAPVSVAVGTGSVSLWIASLSVVPCLHHNLFAACALVGGGVIRGAAHDVPAARTGLTAWMAVGARAAWRIPVTRGSALGLHLDILAQPAETEVRIGDTQVWTTPRLSGALGLSWLAEIRPDE